MNCDTVTKQLPLMLYGELTFDEEEIVQQHLDGCAVCRAEADKLGAFQKQLDSAEVDVPPELLANCRRTLRVSTAAIADNGGPRRNLWESLAGWLGFEFLGWHSIGKPFGALALVAVGFFGARMIGPNGGALRVGTMGLGDTGPVASRVRFVEPRESGRVQIVLEETRQRILSGGADDNDIRGLLLRAARESSDPGVRVDTLDLLKTQCQSEEVRKALLHALQHDANAGVRLKALEALRPFAADDDTRTVLAQVLLKDDNPGVRTQAVDLLTQKRAPELVGLLQELMTRENNNYVRMKCQRALNEMNASVETF